MLRMPTMQQAGAQNRQIAQAIEIHRFLGNPWIPVQSMDPQIAQHDPWIAQIHRLRPTAPLPPVLSLMLRAAGMFHC